MTTGNTVSLNQIQHNQIVRKAVNAENGVGGTVEFLDSLFNGAVKKVTRFQSNAKVRPLVDPIYLFAIQDKIA